MGAHLGKFAWQIFNEKGRELPKVEAALIDAPSDFPSSDPPPSQGIPALRLGRAGRRWAGRAAAPLNLLSAFTRGAKSLEPVY